MGFSRTRKKNKDFPLVPWPNSETGRPHHHKYKVTKYTRTKCLYPSSIFINSNFLYRSGCLRRLASPDKGFAQHRFRRKRDQGWQNVPEYGRPSRAARAHHGKSV
jgi:hypothetical protein